MKKKQLHLPKARGLYNPNNEKENCGVGFIANLKSNSSHQITQDALEMLSRMDHRGACGCEANTGDGAGILTDIPHKFFSDEIKKLFGTNVTLGNYGVGNVFLPQDQKERDYCIALVEKIIKDEGQSLIGWRNVPIDPKLADVGDTARESQPQIMQLIIENAGNLNQDAFEGVLYVIRKNIF
jgi:glutamate synthase (NADPH/NADH) large chain